MARPIEQPETHGKVRWGCLDYLSFLAEQEPVRETRVEFPLTQCVAKYWMEYTKLVH